jgi:hypothetical protein
MGSWSPHRTTLSYLRRCAAAGLPLAVAAFIALGPATPGSAARHVFTGRDAVSAGVQNALAFHQSGAAAPQKPVQVGPGNPTLLPNVRVSNQGTSPADETPIAANPLNGSQLESGANDYNCTSIQGFYNSDDGGFTWPHQHCMTVLAGKLGFGDPNVAYGADGTAYILGIDANSSALQAVIAFQKSTDNGVTWSTVAAGPTTFYPGGLTDKNWTEIDHTGGAHNGCIYTSITQFDSTFNFETITVDHSCDGGATWSGPIAVSAQAAFPTVRQFSDLAIGSDGTVYASWIRCSATGPAGDCGNTTATVEFSKSTDGGNTWSAVVNVHTVTMAPDSCFCAFYGNVPTTSDRVSNIPTIDADASGNLYIADYNYTGVFMQGRVSKSTTGGTTWNAPVNIFGTSTSDQFFHWLVVDDATGKIGVVYLRRTAGNYKATVAVSTNGGTSFKGNKPLATANSTFASCLSGGGTAFMGDYIGAIWAGTTLHATWPDDRTGTCEDEWGGVTF